MSDPTPGGQLANKLNDRLDYEGKRVNRELKRRTKRTMRLSPGAADRLTEVHTEFFGEVGMEAVRIAKRADLETVDEVHVTEARDRLWNSAGPRRWASICTSLGGLLTGAGGAQVLQVSFADPPASLTQTLLALALSIVGVIILTIGVVLTAIKRL